MQPDLNQAPGQVPQPQSQPQPAPGQSPQFTPVVPGKTMGIVGFIFAFVGLQLPGLILSIISLVKAKKVGQKNIFALLGIILNAVFFVGAILILVPITLVAYNGITARTNSAVGQAAAQSVAKYAEAYNADNGTYPTTYSKISSGVGSGVTQATSPIIVAPAASAAETIEFNTCGTDGDKIGYWSYADNTVDYLYVGIASSSSTCTFVSE